MRDGGGKQARCRGHGGAVSPGRVPMTGAADTHRTPLSSWPRPVAVATVLAYRACMGERGEAMPAFKAGWRPSSRPAAIPAARRAARGVPLIVSAAARDHPDWLYRPARKRIAREEAWWRARDVWPPPKSRRDWPEIR